MPVSSIRVAVALRGLASIISPSGEDGGEGKGSFLVDPARVFALKWLESGARARLPKGGGGV